MPWRSRLQRSASDPDQYPARIEERGRMGNSEYSFGVGEMFCTRAGEAYGAHGAAAPVVTSPITRGMTPCITSGLAIRLGVGVIEFQAV
jgi:hypothetical protein